MPKRQSSTRGFKRAAGLLNRQIRKAGESRGFAVSRLLTHWEEVVGAELAALAQPVKVGYGRAGLGATLTVLVPGAQAPLVEMSKERLREKVNAAYGYNAIARINITQTAAQGFAEAQARFSGVKPRAQTPAKPAPARGIGQAGEIRDEGLREALERLGQNVLSRQES